MDDVKKISDRERILIKLKSIELRIDTINRRIKTETLSEAVKLIPIRSALQYKREACIKWLSGYKKDILYYNIQIAQ